MTKNEQIRTWEQYAPTNHRSEELYAEICEKLRNKEHFSFFRLGDGDLKAYLNIPQKSILTEPYRRKFVKSVKPFVEYICKTNDPRIIFGVENTTKCMKDITANYPEIRYFFDEVRHTGALENNSTVWMHTYVYHGLGEFFKSLDDRTVILVGHEGLSDLPEMGVADYHIETKLVCAWDDQQTIQRHIDWHIEKIDNPVILYACSVSGKMLIADLYKKYPNITQIDMGSALDPYCNSATRPWQVNETNGL